MPSSDATSATVLPIDEAIYDRATVLRAAYWFTDRCYVHVTRPHAGTLHVHLKAKDAADDVTGVAGEFMNSLLDYELRRLIQQETGKIREILVAKAISTVGTSGDPTPNGAGTEDGACEPI